MRYIKPKNKLPRKELTKKNYEQIGKIHEQILELSINERICPLAIIKQLYNASECLCTRLDHGEL